MRALSGRAIAVAPEPRSGTAFGAEAGAMPARRGHRDLPLQVADETQLRGGGSLPEFLDARGAPSRPQAAGT